MCLSDASNCLLSVIVQVAVSPKVSLVSGNEDGWDWTQIATISAIVSHDAYVGGDPMKKDSLGRSRIL